MLRLTPNVQKKNRCWNVYTEKGLLKLKLIFVKNQYRNYQKANIQLILCSDIS